MNAMTTDDGKHAPTPEQLAGVIRGLDFACEYCDRTQAFDSARNIREAAAAIGLLRNSHATLLRERDELRRALEAQHKWSEALSNRIRDAVYASEELKDPLAFKYLDEDFFNGVAASYEDGYVAALTASADKADSKSGGG